MGPHNSQLDSSTIKAAWTAFFNLMKKFPDPSTVTAAGAAGSTAAGSGASAAMSINTGIGLSLGGVAPAPLAPLKLESKDSKPG